MNLLSIVSNNYSSVRTWGATDRVVNVNTKIYDTNDDNNPMFFPRKANRYHSYSHSDFFPIYFLYLSLLSSDRFNEG